MFKPNLNRGQQSNQPAREANSGPLKLPQLWNAPELDDMMNLLSQAQRRAGSPVELPFSVSGIDKLFQIRVLVTREGDPEWTFSSGTLSGLSTNWSLPTIDVHLVHNLLLSECTGQHSADLIADHSSFQRPTTGSYSMPPQVEEPQYTTQQMAGVAEAMRNLSPQRATEAIPGPQAALEGDLEKLALPAILQSLNLGKKTGKLVIAGQDGSGEIYFLEGNPNHATTGELTGDFAMIEMLTWQTGKFKFFESEKAGVESIQRRLDSLIIEGMTFLDQVNHLKSIGLTMESFLKQGYPNLSETQFEQVVSRGTGFNMQAQKDFFLEVDDQTNLYDILRRVPMSRIEWVPILYNLLQVGLVVLAQNAAPSIVPQVIEPTYQLDENAIQMALKPLQRVDTEVFTYPVLQYFVKQEHHRYERDGKAFSLIVFDLMLEKEGSYEFLPVGLSKVILNRIHGVKRDIDVLGHFETFDFGLLLPQTGGKGAIVVVQRIQERLKSSPLPGLEYSALSACFGVASIPQDCKSIGGLLVSASEAKKYARKNNLTISEFKPMTG